MKIQGYALLGAAATLALTAPGALAQNVITVNATQIFGTIDPANDQ